MSDLDLSIHLDRPDATYHSGDEVTGHVVVAGEPDREIRRVSLAVGWRTAGRGNTDRGEHERLELLDRPTRSGRGGLRLPFRFTAPPGPATYRGAHLSVVSFVQARADVAWAADPRAEVELSLRPRPGQAAVFQGPSLDPDGVEDGPARIGPRWKRDALIGSIMTLTGLAAILYGRGLGLPPTAAAAVYWGGIGLLFAGGFSFLRPGIVSWRLSGVDLVLDRTAVAPGEAVRVGLRLRSGAPVTLQQVTAWLRATETTTRGRSQHRTTRRRVAMEVTGDLSGNRRISTGGDVALWTVLRLPPDAPFSFESGSNRLDWRVEVRIAIAWWPDWIGSRKILVWPVAAGAVTHAAAGGAPGASADASPWSGGRAGVR